MSQFGFFNAPQSQPARPPYDAFTAPRSALEAPRRFEDPYPRAPSPPRFFSSAAGSAYPPGPLDRAYPVDRLDRPAYSLDRPVHPLDRAAYPLERPVHPLDRDAYPIDRAPHPLDRAPHPLDRDPYPLDRPVHPLDRDAYPLDRAPHPLDRAPHPLDRAAYRPEPAMVPVTPASAYYPPASQPMAPAAYDLPRRDAYPSSWRAEPPQEKSHQFFNSNDTWRSAPARSPPRERYNSSAFAPRKDHSPERRKSHRDDRDDGWRTRPDDRDKRDHRDRRSHDDHKDRKRGRSRSRDRKREDRRDEKTDRDHRDRERDSKSSSSKEKVKEKEDKENGEKKRRVEEKKEEEIKEVIETKEEEKIEPEPEETVMNDEPENNGEEKQEEMIVGEDEFEYEYEEDEDKVEEPKKDESKSGVEPKHTDDPEANVGEREDHDRQSRIRSPSVGKKSQDHSRSGSVEKKKDDSGFRILKDATFEEVHLPGIRPYGNFTPHHHHSDRDSRESRHHSGDASWAEQWKAKVMITKTAVHGLGGAPSGPPVPPAPVAAALPPPVPRAYDAYDGYAARHAPSAVYADERLYAEERRPLPPPRAYPPARSAVDPYAYDAPLRSAYGAPPARPEPPTLHPLDSHREEEWMRSARELYERRLLADELAAARSRTPPPPRRDIDARLMYEEEARREMYERREEIERRDEYERRKEYERRTERPRSRESREYYEDRYRSERERYLSEHSPAYERAVARDSERERHASHRRSRSPLPPAAAAKLRTPPAEEIDPSKLVEPLEDDGWEGLEKILKKAKGREVIVEKKIKKPLIASAPPAPVPPPQHRPVPRDPLLPAAPLPVPPPSSTGGFFSQQQLPSTRSKIAFSDSKPFYKNGEESLHHDRPSFFPAPAESRAPPAGYMPPPRMAPTDEAYGRALSYEDLASSNGAAAYRGGPAPGWERERGRGY